LINVIWHEGSESRNAMEGMHGRNRYAATCMLNDMFDTYDCRHWIRFYDGLPNVDGAVVVLQGANEAHLINPINEDLSRLKWAVVIVMGDEESRFPCEQLRHPNMKLWVQSPIPNRHRADRFLIFGYMWDCHKYIIQCDKDLDWSFSGQVTHSARQQMADAAKNIPNGKFIGTQGFAQGLKPKEYFELLSRSKIVLCPTGPFTPDSFRFSECLEAGGIPIVDEHPSNVPNYPDGFWKNIFPNFPFPIVQNWNDLAFIIEYFDFGFQQEATAWWTGYKTDFYSWLRQDLSALGAHI
jgi:hypothetical protein